MEQQTVTMMSEEETPEVGPNDIVIHLVNPYKCGQCELEFLEKTVFKEHMFSHLEQIKQERPSSQIVMNITLPPETPGGVTVTRDILQLGEDGSIKQVLQPANNITLNQVSPLRELEEAGVIKLDPPKPLEPVIHSVKSLTQPVQQVPKMNAMTTTDTTNAALGLLRSAAVGEQAAAIVQQTQTTDSAVPGGMAVLGGDGMEGLVKAAEEGEETEVSEIVDNKDGSFSVAFKGPNNEMQHIQILRPEGMKGDMMLELTNVQGRRRHSRSGVTTKSNECDICGKVLSSSTNLIRHKMYHSSERPFVCEVCNKGFKDVSNLKKHTQIHKRIYPCFLCKKSFLRKSLLAIHLKRHEARTTFVKTGSSSKEVTMRTFVDGDGTRVEEMSMVALAGQTFEYKHRIMKADPAEVTGIKKEEDNSSESGVVDTGTTTNPETEVLTSAADEAEGKVVGNSKPLFTVTSGGLREAGAPGEEEAAVGTKPNTDGTEGMDVDDLPDMKIPPVPEEFVKLYQCGHCGKRTVQRGNMMRHLIHHLKDKPFVCDECPKQFVDKGELVKHKKTHTKPYRCHQCNGAFAHNVQLIKHLHSECLGNSENLNYTVLDDGKTYKCDICHIEMKRLGNMIKHVSTHSYDNKRSSWPHRSLQTPKAVKSSNSEQVSPATQSPNALYYFDATEQAFFCSICLKMFKQRANAHRHVKVHIKEKPFLCQKCNKEFPNSNALKKHVLMHRRPYRCDMCKASFSHRLLLEAHKRKHSDKERDEETADYGVLEDKSGYYCKHCDKKLTKKYRMMSHIRSHLNQRPFECQICNKCFSCQYMLQKHKKSHATPFICDKCGVTFSRKFFLNMHKKKMHCSEEGIEEEETGMDGDGKEFLCSICKAPFSRVVIKMNHEKKCREESKVLSRLPSGKGFKCKICNKVATLKHNLMVHIRKHEDAIRMDSSGRITLLTGALGEDDKNGGKKSFPRSMSMLTKRSRSPRTPRKSLISQMNQDMEGSDWEGMEEEVLVEEEQEKELDERCQRTPGGWACTICRRKFTDKDTLLRHLESHATKENSQKEEGKEENSNEEEAEKKETPDAAPEESTDEPPLETSKTQEASDTPLPKVENGNTPATTGTANKKLRVRGKAPFATTPATSRPVKDPKSLKSRAAETAAKSELQESPGSSQEGTPSRSAHRPSRTQKIPSRFLE
ncbi:zinc finger protein 62 [Aplysia californica]|uniref:Zinc finger protein 62 n=1 Tax=Aplysia californica TaxID=6500 RepID=A0ABM0JHJ7_APLCA|nr:zinc finger protein 62 [Aplysia californica]XP_005093809.1 zinc finger protein 62 [Aplysia californica]